MTDVTLPSAPEPGAHSPSETGEEFYWRRLQERLLAAFLGGDAAAALAVAAEVASSRHLIPFYRRVIQPAMYQVGLLWERGLISVAQEHRASSVAGKIMTALHVAHIPVRSTRGRAVVTAVTNEYHELGSWIIADMLELEGWDVRYLGANTPSVEILSLVRRFRADLLALSVTMPSNIAQARAIIDGLCQTPELSGTTVLVGGAAFNDSPDLWRELGADGYASDVEEALQFTREWWKNRS